MYQMGAKAAKIGLDMYVAGEAAKANQRQDMANAKLAQQARKTSFNRESQAYMSNMQSLKNQNTADNFNISIAAAEANDNLAMATAGSGISGASVDELSTSIAREVGRDRMASKQAMQAQRDAANQQRIQSNENRVTEATNEYVHDYSADLRTALVKSVSNSLSM